MTCLYALTNSLVERKNIKLGEGVTTIRTKFLNRQKGVGIVRTWSLGPK